MSDAQLKHVAMLQEALGMPAEELGANLTTTRQQIRLSPRTTRFSTARMKQFLRRLGISGIAYRRWSGGQSFGDFIAANPGWSLRAWQVLMVENSEVIKALHG